MSYLNVSQSTKHRRFFEEIETVHFLVNNQLELNPQTSTSHDNESSASLPLENFNNVTSMNSMKSDENLFRYTTFMNDFDPNHVSYSSNFDTPLDTDSDESDSNEMNIFNEKQHMLSSLAKLD